MAGDEEGFTAEGEGVEVVESEGEEGGRREERENTVAIVVVEGGEVVGEFCELKRG